MSVLRDRTMLAEQRQAIVSKIEDAALALMSNADADPVGARLVATVMQQAAEIARWVPYDPIEQRRTTCPECGRDIAVSPNGNVFSHRDRAGGGRCTGSRRAVA